MERGVSASRWTHQNIAQMRNQLRALGLAFDWDRELATCDAEYYKWTQWLFVRLLRAGQCDRSQLRSPSSAAASLCMRFGAFSEPSWSQTRQS